MASITLFNIVDRDVGYADLPNNFKLMLRHIIVSFVLRIFI